MKNSSSRIITLALALLLGCASTQQNIDVRKLLTKADQMDLIEANDKTLAAPVLE